jgi:kynurenine formamidase
VPVSRGLASDSTIASVLAEAEIVDLSVTLDELLPCVWPGNMHFEHNVENWYVPLQDGDAPQRLRSVGPWYTCWMTLHEHVGTHFDAPPHYIPPSGSGLPHASEFGDLYGDKVPLGKLQGTAAVVDVRHLCTQGRPGFSPPIGVDLLRAWEDEYGPFEPGEAVLLQTGWDAYYVPFPEGSRYARDIAISKSAPAWPAPTAEAVGFLADRGVETLGIDAPSIGAAHEPNPAHYAGLSRGLVYVESLANLSLLPVRGSYFVFLPLRIARSSGAPGRAFAYVPRIAGDDGRS